MNWYDYSTPQAVYPLFSVANAKDSPNSVIFYETMRRANILKIPVVKYLPITTLFYSVARSAIA